MVGALDNAVQRGKVTANILDCKRCDLQTDRKYRPVPYRGHTPNPWMILGEAPGRNEAIQGKPLVGNAGRSLAIQFEEVGLPPLERFFIANAVCCYPNGTPEPEHIVACKPNLMAQILLCDPQWILLFGRIPLAAIGVRETISHVHGRAFTMPAGPAKDRRVFATFHPAAGLRDKTGTIGNKIKADLSTFAKLITGAEDWHTYEIAIGRGGTKGVKVCVTSESTQLSLDTAATG